MKYSIDSVNADSYFIMLLNCLFGEDTWGLQCMLGQFCMLGTWILSLNFVVLQIKLNCWTLKMSYLVIMRRKGFDLVFCRYWLVYIYSVKRFYNWTFPRRVDVCVCVCVCKSTPRFYHSLLQSVESVEV